VRRATRAGKLSVGERDEELAGFLGERLRSGDAFMP